jgi:hypothetical protein
LGRAGVAATGPVSKKFLRRFFQKAATFFLQTRTRAGTRLSKNRCAQAAQE